MNRSKYIVLFLCLLTIILPYVQIEKAYATNLPFKISLREHKVYAAYDPAYVFSKPSGSLLKMYSYVTSLGTGYTFFTASRVWLNGKYIMFRWDGTCTAGWSFVYIAKIYDGEYIESSDTDFPSGSAMITKGQGLLQTLVTKTGTFVAETQDILVNIAGNQSKCTVMFMFNDAWGSAEGYLNIDWIEINGASGGSDNKYLQPMDDSVSMGRTGGTGDYGTLGSGIVVGPFVSINYTTNGLVYRNGISVSNGSILDLGGDVNLEALSASNKTFIRWLINGTSSTLNPKSITVLYNTTIWCYFGSFPVLTGDAVESDVVNGKTFYNNSTTKRTGTLTLVGNATESDVLWGQTFYNDDFILRYGTYVAMPPFDFADGNATESDVLWGQCFYNNSTEPRYGTYIPFNFVGNATEAYVFQGYMFYNNSTEPRYGTYIETKDTFPIGIGAGIVIGLIVGTIIGRRD